MTTIVFGIILFTCYFFERYKMYNPVLAKSSSEKLFNSIVSYTIPITTISCLVGFRYNVGVDYPIYKDIYEQLTSSSFKWSLDNSGVEWLYTVICVICHKAQIPYYGFFFIMTLLPMCFFYNSFKHCKYILFPATFFLFASGVFFWYMNIMRQGIAFFIILYSIQFIIKRSFLKYIFWIIIASGFHNSSYLFLPVYCLAFIPNSLPRWFAFIIYIFTWFLSNQLISLLFYIATPFLSGTYIKYANVLQTWVMGGGSGLGVLALHFADLSLIILSPLCIKEYYKERFDIYYNIFIIGAFISNIAGLNMLLSRIPFCFISMRIVISGFSLLFIYKYWKSLNMAYKLTGIVLLLTNLAYLTGNLINLDYNFIQL